MKTSSEAGMQLIIAVCEEGNNETELGVTDIVLHNSDYLALCARIVH